MSVHYSWSRRVASRDVKLVNLGLNRFPVGLDKAANKARTEHPFAALVFALSPLRYFAMGLRPTARDHAACVMLARTELIALEVAPKEVFTLRVDWVT